VAKPQHVPCGVLLTLQFAGSVSRGWKRFMELSKVYECFTTDDTLVIKAQVQVIRCGSVTLCR